MDNKENIKVMEGGMGTPNRLPLQEVGNIQSSTPTFMKRAQYSQVTPFFTPKAKTPLRQKVQVPCAMRALTEAGDIPLNSLIFKKVNVILAERQKKHDDALEEKTAEIQRLQHQLNMINLADQLPIPSEINASANDTVDCGCSPYPTPTPLFTNRSVLQRTSNRSTASLDANQAGNNQSPLSSKSQGRNKSLGFLPQLDSVSSVELGEGWSITKQLDYGSSEALSSPNKHGDTPDSPQCSPLKEKTLAESTKSNVTSNSQGTEMTPARLTHVETMVTPCRTMSVSIGMTPVSTQAGGTNTETVCGTDVETNTETAQCSDLGTNTDRIEGVDIETNTESVQSSNIETNTEVIQSVDSQTMMTPVRCKDMAQCTSPLSTHTKQTCTTPIKSCQFVDASVGTSPVCTAIPRPSEIDFGSLGVEDLALQLESAAISNTLLRSKVDALQQEKSTVLRQAAMTSGQVKQRDEELRRLEAEVVRREKLAKMSATTHVDELMEQQSQLLSQISNLKAELEKRNTAMVETKAAHEQRIATLQGEMANLRKDLVTAYQLRKQQVEEIKAGYLATDYKPHYERARQELNMAQARVAAFTGLGDEILKAQQLQEEAADLVSLRAREVEEKMELVTQHFKQHREWERQHQEIEEQAAAQRLKVTSLEAETEQLNEQLNDREEEANKLKEEIAKSLEREKIHFVELESIRATLDLKNKEVATSSEGLRARTTEVSTLTKELGSLREALSSQTEAMSKLTQERNQYMKTCEQQRVSLNMLRTGARRAEQLEHDLEALQAEHKVIKGDFCKQKQDMEMEIEFLTAEHAVHRAEDATSQQRITELVEENTKLKEQTVLAADELEATRAQHHMVLEHKESENNATVNAFDALLEKVSLLRNRINFCKLQCTPDPEQAPQTGGISCRRSEIHPVATSAAATEKSKRGGRKSFITSVLRAVSGVNSPTLPLPTIEDMEEAAAREEADSLEAPPLHTQIQDLTHTLEALFSVVDELTDRVKDAVTLRAEVPRLQETIETQAATIERFKNQKIKLNYNWKTAEQELKNLEQIVETVREVLCVHESEIRKSWREANRLHRLGMFATDNTTSLLEYNPDVLTKTS